MLAVEAAHIREERPFWTSARRPGQGGLCRRIWPVRLVAQDLHPHRVKLMEETFARLGVQAGNPHGGRRRTHSGILWRL